MLATHPNHNAEISNIEVQVDEHLKTNDEEKDLVQENVFEDVKNPEPDIVKIDDKDDEVDDAYLI